jgi:hypothetical protein
MIIPEWLEYACKIGLVFWFGWFVGPRIVAVSGRLFKKLLG